VDFKPGVKREGMMDGQSDDEDKKNCMGRQNRQISFQSNRLFCGFVVFSASAAKFALTVDSVTGPNDKQPAAPHSSCADKSALAGHAD